MFKNLMANGCSRLIVAVVCIFLFSPASAGTRDACIGAADQCVQLASSEMSPADPSELEVSSARLPSSTQQGVPDIQVAVLGLLIVVGVSLGLAASQRVVFYYDRADAGWSLAIFLLPLAGLVISMMMTPQEASQEELLIPSLIMNGSFVGSGIACITSFWNAIKYNQNALLGVLVGVLKVAMGLLMLLTLFGIFSVSTDENRSLRNKAAVLIFLGVIMGVLWKVLVNGHKVERRRRQLARASHA